MSLPIRPGARAACTNVGRDQKTRTKTVPEICDRRRSCNRVCRRASQEHGKERSDGLDP